MLRNNQYAISGRATSFVDRSLPAQLRSKSISYSIALVPSALPLNHGDAQSPRHCGVALADDTLPRRRQLAAVPHALVAHKGNRAPLRLARLLALQLPARPSADAHIARCFVVLPSGAPAFSIECVGEVPPRGSHFKEELL